MNIRQWLPVVSAIMLCCVQSAFAQQSLEQLPDGALRHVESNWVFPETIGNFKRSGVPTAVGGIASVIYTRPIAGVTAMATLMVTPTMNRSAEAAFEEMKATTAQTYKSRVLTQLWSSGPFKLSDEPKLIGRKAFFKLGVGSVTGLSNQYLIATDKWMVRIRTSSAVITPELIKEMDAFVRALLWDRLTVSGVCQGFDCKSEAVRFHAAAEEQYTVLRLEQGKEDLFPPSQIPCDSQTIASWLNPPPVVLESGADGASKAHTQFLGTCAVDKKSAITVLRTSLPAEMLRRIEREGADGLSLNGPFTFLAFTDGKQSYLGQLHDGPVTQEQLTTMMHAIVSDRSTDFAKGNKKGRDLQIEAWIMR